MLKYSIDETERGKRVDRYLVEQEPLLSRGLIKKLALEDKLVFNGKIFRPGDKFKHNGTLEVDYDLAELKKVEIIELPIIYEDDNVLVIDKPSGIITHNRGRYWNEPSVASFLRSHMPEKLDPTNPDSIRAGIVHRLDRATSGIIICAKNKTTLNYLQEQFAEHSVEKTYLAVIKGDLEPKIAIIDRPIARNPNKPQTFMVSLDGKSAVTKYQVINFDGQYSLLQLSPKTGRTHQLRVHLLSINHPIVGDSLYNGDTAERLMLHAYRIKIDIPKKGVMIFESPKPKEFLL